MSFWLKVSIGQWIIFFFSSRRRHTRLQGDWSSDVCSSDLCIAQGYVLGDQRRPKLFTGEQYFKCRADMVKLFADLPQALDNSVEIAQRCNLEIELGKNRLPAFPTPPGVTVDQYLENAAEAGLARRLEKLGLKGDAAARYRERLAFEIRTIVQMGFAGYFLIVADFINWARTNGVPVGPGRGSGAGS